MGGGSAGLFWAGEVGPHGEERTFSISRTCLVSGAAGPGVGQEGPCSPRYSKNNVGAVTVVGVGH